MDSRGPRGLVPMLLVSGVVVLVALGQARGMWLANLHNGLLALAFTLVGAYVLFQRPGHREGLLFMATGVVEAVMFYGRQVGHWSTSPDSWVDRWLGWLGVWPIAVALALATLSVFCFPDGRLPSPRWRWVAAAVVLIAAVCAALSALWPVEYAATSMPLEHPVNPEASQSVSTVWDALAHPSYAIFQVLWVVAIVARWRGATTPVRRQLAWLVLAAAVSVVALAVGLAVWQTPRPGLLTACLVPVAAGLAVVHGQQARAYSALSWLSRSGARSDDLPTNLARAVAEALAAPAATLWIRVGERELHAVGVWPETDAYIAPATLADLRAAPDLHLRPVERQGEVTGAITVDRPRADRLSLAEAKLLDDLASQAALVVDHLNLADVVAGQRRAGFLDGLSPRENEVLELMARGLSNAAICQELHLSIKTVEPVVSAIFVKLGLHADAGSNRRVLAVLAYLRS
ncbi:helix-turn-helix transcriptional regulator [Nocardioides speluncae]|uniref:helix-turn-helix transcriptional regulator n=1 Tax=Nocardioides speluncae TaxID=2670337 RepID=UPI00197D5ABC|nr:LuxR C-terminal-related transcriptional regulator [Nocardioides speluncae]